MTGLTGRALLDAEIREAEWQRTVRGVADLTKWQTYHTHDSRRSDEGFPDLVLVRGTQLVFAELKRAGEHPTVAQREWLDALARVTRVSVRLWRPQDIDDVERLLNAPHGRAI